MASKQSDAPPAASAKTEDCRIGKFANKEELLRAYLSLEKEFTRRAEKLSRLRAEVDALKALRKGANRGFVTANDVKDAEDKFYKELPQALPFKAVISEKLAENPSLSDKDDCFKTALLMVLIDDHAAREDAESDRQAALARVLEDDGLKAAVIRDYLVGISSGAPPVLMPCSGRAGVSPAVRPKSIREAGVLMLKQNI